MSRTVVNFLIDVVLFSITLSLLVISAILRFVFPAPSTAAGWTLWGYGYDAWDNLQFALVALIGLAIVIHVMMHWSWVCGVVVRQIWRPANRTAKADDGSQTLWGVGLLIVVFNIMGALVGLALVCIRSPGSG